MSEILHNYIILNRRVIPATEIDLEQFEDNLNIYEVIRIVDGVPLFYEDHFNRFLQSAKIIDISIDMKAENMVKSIEKLIKANKTKNGNIKLSYHIPNDNNEPPACSMYFIKHNYPTIKQYKYGVRTILFRAERNTPNAKILNRALRRIVDKTLFDENIRETIYINSKGNITEGSRSNIFIIKKNKLLTPPGTDVLKGITRMHIIDLAKKIGIDVQEMKISVNELEKADAVFLSGTSPKILPISHVGHIKYNVNNPLVCRLMSEFDKHIQQYIENFKNQQALQKTLFN